MEKMQDKLMQQFQNMDKAYEGYAKKHGMTYIQLVVLEEIYEIGEGCTQKKICEDTFYPKQSINLVVKAFLENGYIELREMQENRKNKEIHLTEQGQQLCRDVVVPLLKQEEAAVKELDEKKMEELTKLLTLYSESYCEKLRSEK